MAKKQPRPAPQTEQPIIYEARLETDGGVRRVREVSDADAIDLRRRGLNVVVCGGDIAANRRIAGLIEQRACGEYKRHAPEKILGPRALPHYQPMTRPPYGHTFYETPNRKAR